MPRAHHETLGDLPTELVGPLFERAQRLSRVVETGMGAAGSFVAPDHEYPSHLELRLTATDVDWSVGSGAEVRGPVEVARFDRRFGLVVDRVINTEEIVVKAVGGQLKQIGLYSGATVLGDGTVALILDVPALLGDLRTPSLRGERGEHAEGEGGGRDQPLGRI